MKPSNFLLLGSGGRESAISWKLGQSAYCKKLYIAPGNAGTEAWGENIPCSVTDFATIRKICLEKQIDIVIPGGEDALVAGIVDFFQQEPELQHIYVAGPSRIAAQLEGSKAFAKQFMQRHHIPTASYREFEENTYEEGVNYIRKHPLPVVLKADGLAAGKGVVICQDHEDAVQQFTSMIRDGQFGDAGKKVVVESFLDGIELSVFILTDGKNYVLLPEAKDYKRIGEGDTGLNTGGMGAISPVPFADAAFMEKIKTQIIEPTLAGLKADGIEYRGFIFFGLINVQDSPYVIEYNCRMGDPETEVVLPRLKADLGEMIMSMKAQALDTVSIDFESRNAATVMLVSKGYPGSYEKGKTMQLPSDSEIESVCFHAGTATKDNRVITSGGRVMAVTSLGNTLREALETSYRTIQKIDFEGKTYRKDIGYEFLG
jgi:phosphoribosylamine--glycine ligase